MITSTPEFESFQLRQGPYVHAEALDYAVVGAATIGDNVGSVAVGFVEAFTPAHATPAFESTDRAALLATARERVEAAQPVLNAQQLQELLTRPLPPDPARAWQD